MTQFIKLFEPGKIGNLIVRNRIVMSAVGLQANDANGFVRDHLAAYFEERAKGGVGLIITGVGSAVRFLPTPGMNLHDDRAIPGLRKVNEAVHRGGARIAWQLGALGKELTQFGDKRSDEIKRGEIRVLAPSAIPWMVNNKVPKEATRQDIADIVESFGEAARRVKESGADALEIHGAHGKLIGQFLSPRDNRRTDEYGGSAQNRARFPCEVIRRVRQKVGADFPIIFRFSADDFIPGGITLQGSLRQSPLFVEAGADALHVSASDSMTSQYQFLSYHAPDGAITYLAEAVKKVVNVPVITVGRLGDPDVAERMLQQGKADFVAMGRPLLADPHLPNKVKAGRPEDIVRCIHCNNCLMTAIRPASVKARGRTCTVNPAMLRERSFQIVPATSPKKVMVVGGGLAGMEAARTLAERGHRVTLYEKTGTLGGQWAIASQQPGKQELGTVTERLIKGLQQAGVPVKLNCEVTGDFIRESRPDAVVVATGAVPSTPAVPGVGGENVVHAIDVITGQAKVGKIVVVVGGRYLGMEIADQLAGQGKAVTLVTRRELGRDVQDSIRRELRDRLVGKRVPIFQDTPVDEIRYNGVIVVFNHDLLFLKADTVVLAAGSTSCDRLSRGLQSDGVKVYTIGDCVSPRDACDAIREGAEVGREI